MVKLNLWKLLYLALAAFRIYWTALPQYGYIHPDEFFQSVEPIAGDALYLDVHKTWEFDAEYPIRSMLVWHIMCAYPLSILKMFKISGAIERIDSYWLLVIPRFMMCMVSFLTDRAIMKVTSHLGVEPYKAGFLSACTVVTLVFHTRTFTNSLESCFLALLMCTVIDIVKLSNTPPPHNINYSEESSPATEKSPKANIVTHSSSASDSEPEAVDSNENGSSANAGKSESNVKSCENEENGGAAESKENKESTSEKNSVKNSSQWSAEASETESSPERDSEVSATEVHDKMEEAHGVNKKAKLSMKIEENQKYYQVRRVQENRYNLTICMLTVVGFWVRPSFLAYAFAPGIFFLLMMRRPLRHYWFTSMFLRACSLFPYVINIVIILVMFDTSYYGLRNAGAGATSLLQQLKLPPLNFIIYNSHKENLAEHGIHPRYTHLLVNAPLLFGPVIAFVLLSIYMLRLIKNQDRKRVLSLVLMSFVVPFAILSSFPHQEPRFLVPLIVPCTVLGAFILDWISHPLFYFIFYLFLFTHTFFIGFLYAHLHQAGVVPSLLHFQNLKSSGGLPQGINLVYHRTYMPPKHLLQINSWEKNIALIDLQGKVDDMNLADELAVLDKLFLVTPYSLNYITSLLDSKFTIDVAGQVFPHLSMEDPPDLDELVGLTSAEDGLQLIMEGLTLHIYKLVNKSTIVQIYPHSGNRRSLVDNYSHGSYERLSVTLPKCPSFVS